MAALRRVLESDEWSEFSNALQICFITFEVAGLPRDASDLAVWQFCQRASALLITAKRAGGKDSLEQVIQNYGGPAHLPVITLADPQRIPRDGDYATQCSIQLVNFVDRIEELRGTGRLFLP